MADAEATTNPEDPSKPARLTERVVAFPSAQIRPIPGFIFSVPVGWVVDESPNALGQVRVAEPIDDFWPNVLITTTRMGREFDLEQAAAVTWETVKADTSLASAEVKSEQVVKFGDLLMYVRTAELTPTDGDPVAQVHALFFAPVDGDGQTADFFQLLCSSKVAQGDQVLPAFLEIIGSFRFT
jgi:hypothetical protein